MLSLLISSHVLLNSRALMFKVVIRILRALNIAVSSISNWKLMLEPFIIVGFFRFFFYSFLNRTITMME